MENGNSGVFVVSLDAIDLNLLPSIYNKKGDNIAPLWKKSNFERRNNEYYQFEIVNRVPENSKNNGSSKREFESTVCYICDIDVPKPFLSDHRKSSRHKTNVKIADVALQRMKNYIYDTKKEYDVRDEIDPSAYFCPICVTVIDFKEKNTHEKSMPHRNALIVEKIFTDFLILYNCNEEINNDIACDTQHASTLKRETEMYDFIEQFVKASNKKTVNAPNNGENPSNIVHKNIKKEMTNVTDKEKIPLKEYLDLLKKNCNTIPMFFKALNDNYIEIETVDGSVVKVTDKQFHGFNKIRRKLIQCCVCNVSFKEKHTEEHKLTKMHMKNITLPLKDKHCVRQVDKTWGHCVICNLLTENSDLHSLCNEDHNNNLKEALVSDKLIEDQELSIETDNLYMKQLQTEDEKILNENKVINVNSAEDKCSKDIETKAEENTNLNESELPHNLKKGNITNQAVAAPLKIDGNLGGCINKPNTYFCIACNEYISVYRRAKHNATSKHIYNSISDFHYLMKASESNTNEVACRICETFVNNNIEDVRKHIVEEDHKTKYNLLLLHNRIKEFNNDVLFCDLCNEIILLKNELIHINTKQHQLKCENEFVTVLDHNDDKNKQLDSESKPPSDVEDIKQSADQKDEYYDSDKPILEHAQSVDGSVTNADENDHKDQNENDKLERELSIDDESEKKAIEYHFCDLCNVKVPNYNRNIEEHIKGKTHIKNIKKQSDEILEVWRDTDPPTTIIDINYQIEKTEFSSVLNCKVCKVNILNNELCITKHLEDLSHCINYEKILQNNYLIKKPDDIYCDLCKVSVGLKSELMHIDGKKHKKNLEKRNQELINSNKPSTSKVELNNSDKPSTSKVELNNSDKPSTSKVELSNSVKSDIVITKQMDPEMHYLLQATDDPKQVICKLCNVPIPYNEYNVRTHLNGNKHKNVLLAVMEEITKNILVT